MAVVEKKRRRKLEEDIAQTYNEFKEFEGKKYTGVKSRERPQVVL